MNTNVHPGSDSQSLSAPPRIYRVMKRDADDGLPVVGESSSTLGVRRGYDIHVDDGGMVVLNAAEAGGMSVAPNWRDLAITRIPKRLRPIVPGAIGPNSGSCFVFGTGPFQAGVVAEGLVLVPDQGGPSIVHGVVAPQHVVTFDEFQSNLERTRAQWRIDET